MEPCETKMNHNRNNDQRVTLPQLKENIHDL